MEQNRLEKEVRIGYDHARRSYVSVVREHYLREDISCRSDMCILCPAIAAQPNKGGARLCGTVTHYALPDVQCVRDYLEIWQDPAISDIILLQTALIHLRSKMGRRAYSTARQLLASSVKRCVLFSNEHHWQTFSLRQPQESLQQWQRRLVHMAGVWYAYHLQVSGKAPTIVIVTETPESYSQMVGSGTAEEEGLLVMTMADYLACFWPHLSELDALRESLAASLSASSQHDAGVKDCRDHLSPQAILEGLRKGELLQGRLRVSSHRSRDEAVVSVSSGEGGGEERRITVLGVKDRNRAIHNDRVAVRLVPCSERTTDEEEAVFGRDRTLGVVVGVLQRERREYVASFEESAEDSRGKTKKVLVVPYNIRIPKIRIGTRQASELRNQRIVVCLDSWETDSQYPNGHFVRSLGPIGDLETETAVIMIENDLHCPSFSRALLNELPGDGCEWKVEGDGCEWKVEGDGCEWKVEEEEVGRRRDLRETHLVFSIDPQGCEDVDDTLSVRQLKHGVTELGVHIADVSHFVRPDSLTDREAQERSTTVYLADRRYDMLPRVLNADLCSLLSNVDRYAVSVVWKLDSDYQVKKVWYGRTVIRSKFKLTYEVAQQLFDGESASEIRKDIPELLNSDLSECDLHKRVEELRSAVRGLTNIARVLRHRRAQGGAIELDSIEVKVQMSEDKDATKIENLIPKQPLEVHETIAECMIFANHWVARRIHSSLPASSLLRRHPPPSQDRFGPLSACAGARGFKISTGANKELADSLNAADDPRDPEVNKILRNLATQAMSQAEYFSTGSMSQFHSGVSQDHSGVSAGRFGHYGLALDYYTHFTSPIRRYADLVVHRQLLAVVEERGSKQQLPGSTQLAELCKHMNTKHRSAQLAQIASTELFQSLYFSRHERVEERCVVEGVVYATLTKGVRVYVPRYGVKGMVYLQDKSGLVAQPPLQGSDQEAVIFERGHLQSQDSSVTVIHRSGQYTLSLLDRVRVRVRVEASHAHGSSLRLQLLSCGRLEPQLAGLQHTQRREVVEHVMDDMLQTSSSSEPRPLTTPTTSAALYTQTQPQSSLYCLVQHLHSLSLTDD